MQVAGVECAACAIRVQAAEDGTWCAACLSVLHRRCLEQRAGVCPRCKAPSVPPDTRFAYAELCPVCLRPTGGHTPSCSSCGVDTRWDTLEEYELFRQRHHAGCVRWVREGQLAVAFGMIALVLFVVLVLMTPTAAVVSGPVLLLGIVASSWGLQRWRHARRLLGFR